MKVLCVAEKPSIAKAVANHLGGRVTTVCIKLILELEREMKELNGSRIVFEAYSGSRTTGSTFNFNNGGSATLPLHVLLAT